MKRYLVYQITSLLDGKIYIGIHMTTNINDGYMGSGTRIINAIKKHGIENFKKEILFEYNNPEEMIAKEEELVNRDFIKRKDTYNITCGGKMPKTWDTFAAIDQDGNIQRISINDKRYLSGEMVGVTSGKFCVKDDNGKRFLVSKTDPRYLSGELLCQSKNKIVVKDTFEKYTSIYKTDPRYLSGELIPIWKNKKHKEETKKKIGEANKKQNGENHPQYGDCWIYNVKNNENKKIKSADLNTYLKSGWVKGRKIEFDKNYNPDIKRGGFNRDTCWMYNVELQQNKQVKFKEFEKYISLGWIKGQRYNSNSHWMHNVDLKQNKQIKEEETEIYVSIGWLRGRKQEYFKRNKNLIFYIE